MEYLPSDVNLDIRKLERIFSDMTNSYKIYWFEGMFEEILKGNRVIDFKNIAVGMIASSWYPLLIYNLNFGLQDQLERIVLEINEEYVNNKFIKKEELYERLVFSNNKDLNKLISKLYRYVPYRLLTPFYSEDLFREEDKDKNKIIKELTQNDYSVLYRISSDKKCIKVNECWFKYIRKNENIIRKWIKYNMIEFLQSRNLNVPAIILYKIVYNQGFNELVNDNYILTNKSIKVNKMVDNLNIWNLEQK